METSESLPFGESYIECAAGSCGTLWPGEDRTLYPAADRGRLLCSRCGDAALVRGEGAKAEERRLLLADLVDNWDREVASRVERPLTPAAEMMRHCAREVRRVLEGRPEPMIGGMRHG